MICDDGGARGHHEPLIVCTFCQDMHEEARFRFMMSLKAAYLQAFDDGRVPARLYRLLIEAVNLVLDNQEAAYEDSDSVKQQDWQFIQVRVAV